MAKKIDIGGELHSTATGNIVADAKEIKYRPTGKAEKTQEEVNNEVLAAIGEGGSVETQIDNKINALDASVSQSAGNDGLALSVTEVNGKITSISGSIASGTYDASGAASTAKTEVIGGATTDGNTLKKLEDRVSPLETAVGTGGSVDSRISAAVATETTRAQGAESTLQGSISTETQRAQGAETALDGRIDTLEDTVENVAYLGDNDGSAVIADFDPQTDTVWKKAQVLSAAEKEQVQQNIGVREWLNTLTGEKYVSVAATDQTTTSNLKALIDIAAGSAGKEQADTIYRVGKWDGSAYNEEYYSDYAWDGSVYVQLNKKSIVGEVFDITEYKAGTKYADLAAALGTNGENVPQNVRKGGMSVKYVNTDNNYVQFRYTSSSTAVADFTNIANWQAVDDEPSFESENLVKSGGIIKHLSDNLGYTANPEDWTLIGNCSISDRGGWNVGDTYESKSFDVTELRGTKLIVIANNIGGTIISFVKTIGYPGNPVFATGETGRHIIPVSTSDELIVPVDAVYAVVTTKNDNKDRTPQIYSEFAKFQVIENIVNNPDITPIQGSTKLITSGGVFGMINDAAGNGVTNKTWSANKLFNANQILNMLSTACANEVGNYREYDSKVLDTVGKVVENSDFKIVVFCCLKQDTTISIVNPNKRTIRVFILNAFTGLTAISESEARSQTIPLDSYNSDYTNNIVLVSLAKTASISVDGLAVSLNAFTNNSFDNISDSLFRVTQRTLSGKAINGNGVLVDNTEFNVTYFSTESDAFTISFSVRVHSRTVRLCAFKNGVFCGVVYSAELTSTPPITIDINYPHYGVVFGLSYHRNSIFTISNLVTEDGISESVKTLLDDSMTDSKNKVYLIDTYLNQGRVVYSAHRGLRTVAPENSIPAYEAAGRAGFDFLNLAQLRQSADGTWYVMHDDTIDRTTDGTGAIKNLTDEYLSTVHIDVGPNIEQYTQEELVIPTLEKAIQIARKYGMKLYFRVASITGNSYQTDKAAWDSFIAIIRKYRCEGMLFGGNALTDVLPLHRDLGLDWCINYDVYSSEAVYQQIEDYVNNGIKNATIFTTSEILTDEHIAAARENGFKVMVHLTSDNTTKTQCLEWSNKGVDIIGGVVNYDLSED